jgi:hypothetical protein
VLGKVQRDAGLHLGPVGHVAEEAHAGVDERGQQNANRQNAERANHLVGIGIFDDKLGMINSQKVLSTWPGLFSLFSIGRTCEQSRSFLGSCYAKLPEFEPQMSR